MQVCEAHEEWEGHVNMGAKRSRLPKTGFNVFPAEEEGFSCFSLFVLHCDFLLFLPRKSSTGPWTPVPGVAPAPACLAWWKHSCASPKNIHQCDGSDAWWACQPAHSARPQLHPMLKGLKQLHSKYKHLMERNYHLLLSKATHPNYQLGNNYSPQVSITRASASLLNLHNFPVLDKLQACCRCWHISHLSLLAEMHQTSRKYLPKE